MRFVVLREGFFRLWRGLESTLCRNGSWNAAYFSSVDMVRRNVEREFPIMSPSACNFVASTVGGCIGACFSTPIDVAKIRIQNTVATSSSQALGASSCRSRAPWTLPVVAAVAKEGGICGLYRGLALKLLRLGPGGGLLFVSSESAKHHLSQLEYSKA